MLSIDNYINETTRHATIILPTPSGLEIDHFDIIFNLISVSNNVKFSEALFPPSDERPADWQVLKELIARLTPNNGGWLHALKTPRRIVNWGLMLGPYGKLSHPSRWFSGLSLKKVINSKHGINLGPLVPRVPDGILTLDNKISLAPSVFMTGLDALLSDGKLDAVKSSFQSRDSSQLQLIGRRHVNTNNSWMHQFRKISRSSQVRCTAMINTLDAQNLGIANGTLVKVTSPTGQITLPAEVTDSIRSGVTSIPHGFGHKRAGTRIPIADEKPGVSVNDITDHTHVDEVTGNAAHELASSALDHELLPRVVSMDKVTIDDLLQTERLLVICSTYGEGEMPDNASQLWDAINASDLPSFNPIHYSVLAFGDSSYESFCNAGKQWDLKLEQLGAQRISPRVDCDVDYVDKASFWANEALPAISAVGDQTLVEGSQDSATASTRYSRNNPLLATLTAKRLLTAATSSKETWHIELAIDDPAVQYTPGGVLNIIPSNRESLVDELLSLMNRDKEDAAVKKASRHRQNLLHDLEIRTPSPSLVALIAKNSPHPTIRALLSGGDTAAINEYLWGKDVVSLIADNDGAITSMDVLIDVLSPLAPRSYSIASSAQNALRGWLLLPCGHGGCR